MIVLNPLTKQMRQLPPLLICTDVVMIKLEVNRENKEYKLFVVVYYYSDPRYRKAIAQVYSSETNKWAIIESSEHRIIAKYHYVIFKVLFCAYDCAEGRLHSFTIDDIVHRKMDLDSAHVSLHRDRLFVMEKDPRGVFVRYQIGGYKLLETGSGWVQVATHGCDEVLQDFYLVRGKRLGGEIERFGMFLVFKCST